MKIKQVVRIVASITPVAALALLLTTHTPTALADPPTKFAVFAPGSEMYGYSYGEWSARWWQWALSLPIERNPFFDSVGCLNGDQGQEGPVWFLTGVFNETGIAVRECTIPAGKALFFPVLNLECSTIEAPPWYGSNEQELCDCAKGWMDMAKNMKCKIDGRAVGHIKKYRVQSPMFEVTLPENNVWGFPADTTGQLVSDGVFLMLAPLPPGQHTIEFTGTLADFDFTLHITYYLTVL